MTADSIARNLRMVRERMASAARRAGRSPEDVALVAVTKNRTGAQVADLIAAGHRALGENRVSEALEKIDAFDQDQAEPPLEWHLIGHLQTNKARKAVGRFALIHSVDSLRLAEALQRAADRADCTVDVLLQVNTSGEETKFGVEPREIEELAAGLRHTERVRCRGLMTMAPLEAEPEATRPVFRALRQVRDRLLEAGHSHLDMRHLSMGMTNDFEVAIEEGATLVRVGTALFADPA